MKMISKNATRHALIYPAPPRPARHTAHSRFSERISSVLTHTVLHILAHHETDSHEADFAGDAYANQ